MSAIGYADNVDLNLNELQNFKVQALAADPANLEARLYYNTVSHTLRFYNGTAWQDIAAATYTDEQAQDAVATAFAAGTNTVVTVTYNDPGNSITLGVANSAITLAMLANIPAHTYLGNNTSGALAPIALTKTQLLADLAIAESDVTSLVGDLAAKAPIANPTFTGIVTAPEFTASGLTGAVAASRYVGATASGAPATGTFATGDFIVDQTGTFWVCTSGGTSGTWAALPKDSLVMHLAGTETVTGTKTFNSEVTSTDFKATGLTGAVAATRYVGGTASIAPTTGSFATGDFVVTQAGSIFICTAGGSPGTWAQVTGLATGAAGGDLTGSFPNPTVGTNKITNGQAAQMPANTVKANTTGSTANAADTSLATFKTWLAIAESDVTNLVSDLAAKAPIANPTFTGTVTLPATGAGANEAATKAYVDATAAGIDWKASVRAATVGANVATLAGGAPNTLDGVTLAANDRVLVKDQTTASQNGLYFVATLGTGANGTWTRATDADVSAEVTSGVAVFVEEGTVNADTGWTLTTNGPITLGTTGLTFTQFTSLGQIIDGAALTKTGNTLNVAVDGTTIEVSSDALRIAASAAGAGLGGGGGSALQVNAGTGITTTGDAVNIDTTLVPRMFKGATAGGSTSEVITHSLGTRDVHVQFWSQNTPWAQINYTVEATSINTITVRSGANIVAGVRVVVMG